MNKWKRALSLVLCVAMLISLLPMNVLAVNDEVNGTCTIDGGRIYKLVDGPTAGKNYLILSRNTAGSANALSRNGNNIANQTVTVKAADDKSSAAYVETIGSATVWTAESGLKFQNGNRYLTGSWNALSTGNSGTSFSYNSSNSRLSFTSYSWTRYVRYSDSYYNSGWGVSDSAASVYFYEETDVPDGVYSLVAQDQQVAVGDSIDVDSIIRNLRLDGATIEDTLGGTYAYTITSGDNTILRKEGNNLVGVAVGTATVRVTYTWGNNNVVFDDIRVEVTQNASYTVDIKHEGNSTNILAVKGVTEGTTRQLTADVLKYGRIPVNNPTLTWKSSDPNLVTVDASGMLTFSGEEGKATISVEYVVNGATYTDQITVTASKGAYIIPADGTNDFPEYPNEGSVRFDKTATAVGNFNETGLAQVELSVTGVPYTTNNEIDVVIMLDMSSSMTDSVDRKTPAIAAARAALETIVKNEDGSFNGNRVAIYGFNGWLTNASTYSSHILHTNCTSSGTKCENITQIAGLQSYNQASYNTTYNAIQSQYSLDAGTNYAAALKQCYETLSAAKTDGTGNNRKQFVIFMTDGAASTGFAYVTNNGYSVYGTNDLGNDGYNDIATVAGHTEYFSTQMKNDGVTIYSVGVQIAGGNDTETEHAKTVLKKIGGTSEGNATQTGFEQYAIFVDEDVSELVNAFQQAALSIKEAAKDVVITDQMGSEYTMVFEAPNQTSPAQEYYIEILNYDLDPSTNDRIGNGTSVMKLYMGKANKLDANDNVILDSMGKPVQCYYAASNAGGTAYASPVFEAKPLGSMYYWTTQNITGNPTYSGVSVKVGDTTYYFDTQGKKVADGEAAPDGWYNMTSGAYASGTVTVDYHEGVADDSSDDTNYCNDLIIATPNFVYNANEVNGRDKMLYWTLDKISRTETVMRYFLYLDDSGGYHGDIDQIAGTYPTNEDADLTYSNFQDNPVQQKFPEPQMTWHGAQMSYVFYLVNAQGQPVNRAGRVVPFSEAVYVTDVYTKSVTWSGDDKQEVFQANQLASEIVPDVYTLYDETAYYNIHVFANEGLMNQDNHFEIGGTEAVNTTYVFNTKADAEKYSVPGVYAKEGLPENQAKCSFCTGGFKTVNYNPRAGFDYYDTVVAFAVLWVPSLGEDEIVVDYGLDVVVDVTQNDLAIARPVGLMATPPKDGSGNDVAINSGQFSNPNTVNELELKIEGKTIATATLEGNRVWISMHRSNAMHFTDDLLFYYVSEVQYQQGNEIQTVYMYSSVRIIPATTLYFEEDYIGFKGSWKTVSSGNGPRNTTATQDVDRPGPNRIGAGYDADNVYGFDSAYAGCTEYSMDGAMVTEVTALTSTGNVQKNPGPTATFSFTGTGFDIIGRTDQETTSIIVRVDEQDEIFVDTYFEGADTVNAIKQVPVVTVRDLPYGTHNVIVEVVINNDEGSPFAHGETGKFYLDAVRIYNPAWNDTAGYLVTDAYEADKELSPTWEEFGNAVLKQYGPDKIFRYAMFIDGKGKVTAITDYDTWGPNNELYLAAGQTIVLEGDPTFLSNLEKMKGITGMADMQLGIKLASGTSTSLTVTGDTDEKELTLNSATDLNFSIGALYYPPDAQSTATAPQIATAGKITIKNTGPGLVALTNLKVTLRPTKAAAASVSDDLSGGKTEDPVVVAPQQKPAEPIPEAPDTLIIQGILMIKQTIAALIIAVAELMDELSVSLQRIAEALFAGGGY